VREADQVSFTYHMKHGAIVKDDGSFDFTRADEMVNLSVAAGLKVLGHTLAWHQNQNGNYLRSLTMGGPDPNAPNLLPEGNFEAGTGTTGIGTALFTGWNVLVGGTAVGSFDAVNGNGSSRALQATITTPGANAYDMQAIGANWTAINGTQYKVSIDIKASVSGGKVRLVNQNSQYQQFEITPTTSWETYTWTLTALETSPSLRLNFPNAGVYTIDNISIQQASGGPAPQPEEVQARIDSALSRFVRRSMMRYTGKVHAWDVVNEPVNDGTGTVRTNTGSTTGDIFYWSQYLGRNYALKAFQYAKAADPAAILFINDYNLESDTRKLDSLVAFVNELKQKGAQIDGIGTQMHISVNTPNPGIELMFQKLAATGLKIRISELDIRVNPSNIPAFVPTEAQLRAQADKYQFVMESFIRNVPKPQRYDVTLWGVADSDSWYVTVQNRAENALLFNAAYQKKPAYVGFLKGLKDQ
ncbi:MAG: endo-1,4-beta-xylanase, partial [Flavisolibacter sp.]